MSAPLSDHQVDVIRERHAAVEGGGWYLAPESFATPGTVRATIDGYPRTIAVMDFRGWKADANREFVLRAHDDVGQLLADRDRFADRADMAARIGELELALGSAVALLRSAAVRVNAGVQPDLDGLRGGADELAQVQRSGIESGAGESEVERLRKQAAEMVRIAMGDREVRLFNDPVDEVRSVRTIADAQLARADALNRLCREKDARIAELERQLTTTATARVPGLCPPCKRGDCDECMAIDHPDLPGLYTCHYVPNPHQVCREARQGGERP